GTVFQGDGSTAQPDLRNVDVFTVLPFQVNDTSFVVAYYVMTRNIKQKMTPEHFTFTLTGVVGDKVSCLQAFDPLSGEQAPLSDVHAAAQSLTVSVLESDTPYLLRIDEAN